MYKKRSDILTRLTSLLAESKSSGLITHKNFKMLKTPVCQRKLGDPEKEQEVQLQWTSNI